MGTRTTPVRLMQLGGIVDGLTNLEVAFLSSMLPLFQVSEVPRADVEVARVSTWERFERYLSYGDVDLLHLASHGGALESSPTSLMELGEGFAISPEFLHIFAKSGGAINALVLNTSCAMFSAEWVEAFLEAGALAYIAPKRPVLAKDAAVFSAAFYSAFFGTIHKGKDLLQRGFDSYRVAYAAYRSFVGETNMTAKFYFESRDRVKGRITLPK